MYLFKNQDKLEIPISCKLCLQEIKFSITADEYQKITQFPFKRESIHGEPNSHKLVVFINKNLEIDTFEIEDVIERTAKYTEEITKQVLSEIDLNDEEIELYFVTTGRDAVSLGEMAILIEKTKEECQVIANKFVEKGLFKEILGAQPHYTALPPYAALVSQLVSFHEFISTIKTTAPKQLEESFSDLESQTEGMKKLNDYIDFMASLKEDALKQMYDQKKSFDTTVTQIGQIREITNVIANLEGDTTALLVDQIKDLKGRFQGINKQIFDIMKTQIEELRKEFANIQTKTSQNLKKLRLGVIQQTVDQVIEKVFTARLKDITALLNRQLKTIQNIFTEGLKNTVKSFNNQVLAKLKKTIERIITNVDDITASTANTGEEIKNIFADVSKNFSKAVIMAEEKLGGITESIFKSFGSLRETFSTKVIESLNGELGKILEKLEISEITTREFWDKAKEVSSLTMKDIWFIRSIEAAQAHITDEIAKAKMRILIVAPLLTDIDLKPIKARPKHINIRIATSIYLGDPEHKAILEQLDQMHNVTYRHRDLQNLWGINRDYEEVIICVVSQTEIAGKAITEIAGIGSIIEEHIKIFVPILEDAWVGAHKEILHTIKPSGIGTFSRKRTAPRPTQPAKKPAKKPVLKPTPKKATPQIPLPSPSKVAQAEKEKKPSVMELLSKPVKPTAQPAAQGDDSLSGQFDSIIKSLDTMTGIQVATALDNLKNDIIESRGYSGVLKQIEKGLQSLKATPQFIPAGERAQLIKKINFWRKKLKL